MLLGIFTPIGILLTGPLAGLLAFGAYTLSKSGKEKEEVDEILEEEAEVDELKSPESVVQLLHIDPIEFEFGYGLIPLADANQGGDLLDRIVMIRRQLALELGLVIPVVRIRDNIALQPNEYRLKIKGNEVAKGELLLDHYLAMSPTPEDDLIEGIETVEPSFGLPAKWISEAVKDEADMLGYTVVDPASVVSTHITEKIKQHAHELIGRQETKQLIDHLKESYPVLVEEVTPNPLSVGDIQKVLAKLACSYRMTSPGIGREAGASLYSLQEMYQGFFLAPHVVSQSLKGAVFTARFLEKLGFTSNPKWDAKRTDLIQSVEFSDREKMIAFCQAIQFASPINAHVTPYPAYMPGYEDDVIMAAGTFIQGASIELSADGPIRPPYVAYVQGGLTYSHVKNAICSAVDSLMQKQLI